MEKYKALKEYIKKVDGFTNACDYFCQSEDESCVINSYMTVDFEAIADDLNALLKEYFNDNA